MVWLMWIYDISFVKCSKKIHAESFAPQANRVPRHLLRTVRPRLNNPVANQAIDRPTNDDHGYAGLDQRGWVDFAKLRRVAWLRCFFLFLLTANN